MKELKILFVEDLPTDVEIAQREILKENLSFTSRVVDTAEDFNRALAEFKPDLIISDYSMPKFDGMSALRITRSQPSPVPFIMLTGSINEETAVACMKAGADDYVLKERIRRLPFAVRDVLAMYREKQANERARQELRRSEEKYYVLIQHLNEGLVQVDNDDRILFVNDTLCHMFGYTEDELTGRIGFKTLIYKDDQQFIKERTSARSAVPHEKYEVRGVKKSGERIWLNISASAVRDEHGSVTGSVGLLADITERKQAEEALKVSLREKTQLIGELYHRTKNNMQVIISMLKLQAGLKDDDTFRDVVRETVNRIQTMSLVHEKLYRSQNLSSISLDEYIRDLAQLLARTYHAADSSISLTFDLEPVSALIDIAVPCGLVLNELISNAFKHAFPEKREGEVHIGLHRLEDNHTILLTVSDNGIGLQPDADFRKGRTFGLPTCTAIVEHQLQGKIEFDGKSGLVCRVQFSDDRYGKRV